MPANPRPASRIANPFITGRLRLSEIEEVAPPRVLTPVRPAPRIGPAVARLLSLVLLIAISGGLLASAVYADRLANRGVVRGPDLTPFPYDDGSPLGANVFLEKEADRANVDRSLQMLADGHFKWIRQTFPWNDIEIAGKGDFTDRRGPYDPVSAWAKYDYIVAKANALGIEIMARIDAPPNWARPADADLQTFHKGPPANLNDYGDFVAAVVSRYKGKIRYFQLWNEPNLIGEWGGPADAKAYTALLKVAYQAAKKANPDAVVVMAALAQTDEHIGQPGGNESELVYLQEMYDAGARAFFDIASVMVYGLGFGPDQRTTDLKRPGDDERINFSRAILFREVMERNGDAAKPAWTSEYGWLSLPPDWNGKPSTFGKSVDEQTQARYLVEGYQRALEEWPWMGPMFIWHLRDPDPEPTDPAQKEPARWFALLNQDFSPRPAFTALSAFGATLPDAYTGAFTADNPALHWNGGEGTIKFNGTRLDLVLDASIGFGFGVGGVLDGQTVGPVDVSKWQNADGWSSASSGTPHKVTIAQGLAVGDHTFRFTFGGAETKRVVLGFVVSREDPAPWRMPLAYVVLLGLLGWTTGRFTVGLVRLPGAIRANVRKPGLSGERAGAFVAVLGLVLTLVVYYFSPSQSVAWIALLVWFALAAWRPSAALAITAGVIPFYWVPRYIGIPFALESAQSSVASLPLSETCLWLTLFAWGLHKLLRPLLARSVVGPSGDVTTTGYLRLFQELQGQAPLRDRTGAWIGRRLHPRVLVAVDGEVGVTGYLALYEELQGPVSLRQRVSAWLARDIFGLPALALLAVATFSLITVANPDFLKGSLRAYRWVIVEPLLFYFLATEIMRGRRVALRLLDGFAIGATLAALIALAQAAVNLNVLSVEQVIRIQGTFPHPNNLGITMGRAITLIGVCGLFLTAPSQRTRRRWYLIATLVMLPALVLSFSRGAYIAVALAFLAAFVVANRKWGLIALAGVVFTGVVLAGAALTGMLPQRLFGEGSTLIRFDLWQTAFAMIRDHPIFGIGLDQFLNQNRAIYLPPEELDLQWLSHPHNLLLDCWLSLGIMGMLVGGWIVVRYWRAAVALVRRSDPMVRAVALGALAMLVDFLVHGAVDNSYFLQDLALIFWLACALLQLMRRSI